MSFRSEERRHFTRTSYYAPVPTHEESRHIAARLSLDRRIGIRTETAIRAATYRSCRNVVDYARRSDRYGDPEDAVRARLIDLAPRARDFTGIYGEAAFRESDAYISRSNVSDAICGGRGIFNSDDRKFETRSKDIEVARIFSGMNRR